MLIIDQSNRDMKIKCNLHHNDLRMILFVQLEICAGIKVSHDEILHKLSYSIEELTLVLDKVNNLMKENNIDL